MDRLYFNLWKYSKIGVLYIEWVKASVAVAYAWLVMFLKSKDYRTLLYMKAKIWYLNRRINKKPLR